MFVLKNAGGMEAHISSQGCIIQRLLVPGRDGVLADVVLGYDKMATYLVRRPSFSPYLRASRSPEPLPVALALCLTPLRL